MKPTVAIIGAGISGLSAIKACIDAGVPFVAFEKAAEVGGTWRDNVYPGLRVDSPGATYQFPFAPKYDWSHAYAPGPEIQQYLCDTATKLQLRDNIRFNTEVTECAWVDGRWRITTAAGDVVGADVLVLGSGFLRVPIMPKFAGEEIFGGPIFHSSRWDPDLDVTGKRIGVVGMGSSGIQIVTALSEANCEVTQFVRHPQWVHTIDNAKNSRLRRVIYRRWPKVGKRVVERNLLKMRSTDPRMMKHGDWRRYPGPGRGIAYQAFEDDLRSHIPDARLRDTLTPTDTPGCKRTPLAPGYYAALNAPNVSVVRGGIERLEPNAVVAADGTRHEIDVLVYATGFDTHAYFKPMVVRGLDEADLTELWKPGPFTYRGMMVPGFPNMFVVHGPYTPVNNISVPVSTDDMIKYVMRVVDYVATNDVALSPTVDATERYLTWVRSSLPMTTWASGCDNWYTAADGNVLLWPFGREEHLAMYSAVDRQDFELVPAAAGVGAEA